MTPRVLATVLTLPLLVALGDCAGLLGGFVVAWAILHLGAERCVRRRDLRKWI